MEPLHSKDFLKTIKHTSNSGISLFNGFELKRWLEGSGWDDLDFDVYLKTKNKNLQRDLVWTLEQKRQLIWSILKRMHIPKITVINYKRHLGPNTNRNLLQIIDGKQRVNAFISFIRGDFGIELNGNEYFLNDLDEILKGQIMSYYFVADEYYEYSDDLFTDDEKIYLFELVNFFGTPLDIKHLEDLKK